MPHSTAKRKEPTLGLLEGLFIVFSTVSGMVDIKSDSCYKTETDLQQQGTPTQHLTKLETEPNPGPPPLFQSSFSSWVNTWFDSTKKPTVKAVLSKANSGGGKGYHTFESQFIQLVSFLVRLQNYSGQ